MLNKFKLPIALSLVGIVLIIGGLLASDLKSKPSSFPKESIVNSDKSITVDVSGAVIKPGVYKLNSNLRVSDAISAAGGFSENANAEYISKYLNMAQKISDGAKIYVPILGDNTTSASQTNGGSVSGTTSSQVNINSATAAELEALPGIGPVTANKIISGRPYQSIDDLQTQKTVSKSTFEKIKASITVY